jgi:hypothetical protein
MNTTDLATINQHKIIPTIQPQIQQQNKVAETVNLTQNTPQIRNQNHQFQRILWIETGVNLWFLN